MSYSPARQVVLFSDYAYGPGISSGRSWGLYDRSLERDIFKCREGTAAAGYRGDFNKAVRLELYAGAGNGRKEVDYLAKEYSLYNELKCNIMYNHFMLQACGTVKDDDWQFSLGLRYKHMNFPVYYIRHYSRRDSICAGSHSPVSFLDFAITPSLDLKRIRLSGQFGYSFILSGNMTNLIMSSFYDSDRSDNSYVPFFLSMSIALKLYTVSDAVKE